VISSDDIRTGDGQETIVASFNFSPKGATGLEFEYRIPYPNAFEPLFTRCRELGLFKIGEHWCEGLRRKALSDLPENWLKACFSDDLHRNLPPMGQACNILSDPDWLVILLKDYALALAVMYETPEQAFHFLDSEHRK
jgi:hypothetical protein